MKLSGHKELDKLLDAPEEYNGCRVRPSEAAFSLARLVEEDNQGLLLEFTPDGDAGIDVEWECDGRHVIYHCREDGILFKLGKAKGGRWTILNQ